MNTANTTLMTCIFHVKENHMFSLTSSGMCQHIFHEFVLLVKKRLLLLIDILDIVPRSKFFRTHRFGNLLSFLHQMTR
jgi:hypothetical protein